MPIDDAFQTSTSAVLLDLAQRPRPPVKQAPSFSVWGFLQAPVRGTVAGVSQAAGSAAEIFGGAAQVSGALGTEDWLMPDPVRAAKATEEARQRLKEQGGPLMENEVVRSLRNVAADYMPDPVTSHAAEQAVANLFRVGVKAVAGSAVLGPVAGAAAVGVEEGISTADELGQRGVDWDTRFKVGAVTAAFTAGGLALPVAGQTWGRTAALAVAGGPASFIGQNAATREILANANYGDIASQYDPFDPVGLGLSTLLPLGFGAMAMRGRSGARAAGEPVKTGEVPATEPTTGAPRPDAESVDAARVNLLRENVDAGRPTPASDLAGAAAHDTAMSRALDQLAGGERVDVSDVASTAGLQRVADELGPRLARAADEVLPALRAMREQAEPPVVVAADAVVAPRAAAVGDVAPVTTAAADAGAQPAVKLVGESPQVERAVNILEAERPDLMVHLDGDLAPTPLAQLMERVRAELGRDLEESPLIEAAAACFVSTGG